jgi:1,4-dihydroxy-2-naphthoate octaprenyltransferase
MRELQFWIRAARAPFFTGSLAPILVGTGAAYVATCGAVRWGLAVLALVSLTLLHACANLANDFFDHLSGNDALNTTFVSPFTGGSRVIQRGEARPWEVATAAFVCLTVAALIGFYLVYRAGWPVLWLGLIGGLTGVFYTAPPFRFAYRGSGEPFIFLDFGLLPVLGAYYLQTGRFDSAAFWAGVPVGLLITAILWINQFQDMAADAAVGKRH